MIFIKPPNKGAAPQQPVSQPVQRFTFHLFLLVALHRCRHRLRVSLVR
jgi:hypothetical protein